MAITTHQVNLDALIRREDFEAREDEQPQNRRLSDQLKVEDLERTYFNLLRKPDFQRETASWSPETVVDFVRSFLDGDLIPAVIMWWSNLNGTVFVIDGAHRLSALMSWVHDDYGDGKHSQEFWGHVIPEGQQRFAKTTKQLMESQIGAYQRLKYIAAHPETTPDPTTLRRARNIATFKIDLQWVEGNADTAEKSFFKINGSASPIDPTELAIIKARRRPNAVATRALMNAGTGHKYWSDYPTATQQEIELLSREIYDGLFRPIIATPIKTLDLPIAGQAYSANAFKMIFDLVNMVNEVTPSMWDETPRKRSKGVQQRLENDQDGQQTASFLKRVKRAASLISGNEPQSLGLHPVVYFYGATGRFQPISFLATVKFVRELEERKQLDKFTQVRRDFEEFLISHKHFVSTLGHSLGGRTRSLEPLVSMFRTILEELSTGKSATQVEARLLSDSSKLAVSVPSEERKATRRGKFNSDEKSESFINQAIASPNRCNICGARLHVMGINIDHKMRRQDGGLATADNGQPTHPYCNTGYKESAHARSTKAINVEKQ
ncbi:MAG TPA: DUF262 domain-containing protein [Tepidisphaeraceae bacterium]